MTRAHSERIEAESKLMSNAPGSLDFARDDVLVMLISALLPVFLPTSAAGL